MYFVLTQVLPPGPSGEGSPLRLPFLAVAIVAALASVYFKNRFGARDDRPRPLAMVRAGYVIALVFSEIPALLGLVLFFIANWSQGWVFFGISAGAFVINFPASDDFNSVKPD